MRMKGFTCMQDKCIWCSNWLYNIKSLWDLLYRSSAGSVRTTRLRWNMTATRSTKYAKTVFPSWRERAWLKERRKASWRWRACTTQYSPKNDIDCPFFKFNLPWSYASLYRSRQLSSQAVASYVASCSTVRKTSPGRECGVSSPRRRLLCSISMELRR